MTSPRSIELKARRPGSPGLEELRLGYVAFTRAKHELWVSAYQWSPTRQKPLRPRRTWRRCARRSPSWGAEPDAWPALPEDGTPNPLHGRPAVLAVADHGAHRGARAAAGRGCAGARRPWPATRDPGAEELDIVESSTVAQWDEELERLLAEARADRSATVEVPMPDAACPPPPWPGCATTPSSSPGELARPMPRQPSPAARFGTRFHAWVEARFGQQSLLDPDDLPGRGDLGIDDEDELQRADRELRGRPVRRAGPARGGAAVRARAGRPGGARAHRRGVRRAGRRLAGRGLEDQPCGRPRTRSSSRSTGWRGPS